MYLKQNLEGSSTSFFRSTVPYMLWSTDQILHFKEPLTGIAKMKSDYQPDKMCWCIFIECLSQLVVMVAVATSSVMFY